MCSRQEGLVRADRRVGAGHRGKGGKRLGMRGKRPAKCAAYPSRVCDRGGGGGGVELLAALTMSCSS